MEEREREQLTKQGTREKQGTNQPPKIEDRVLKVAMEAFGEEMLQYLGQEGKVLRAVPTEQVHLELRKMMEDFNFEMEDKSWRHYEFESDRISVEDLRRFREYEAYLSMTQAVPVITTVLCSADVKEALSGMVQGINTYQVEVVQMKQRDADQELKNIWGIIERAEKLSKEQLIPIILLPLMGGKTSIFDRIQQGFQILKLVQNQFEEGHL